MRRALILCVFLSGCWEHTDTCGTVVELGQCAYGDCAVRLDNGRHVIVRDPTSIGSQVCCDLHAIYDGCVWRHRGGLPPEAAPIGGAKDG